MNKIKLLKSALAVVLIVNACFACSNSAQSKSSATQENELQQDKKAMTLADPYILADNGTYYAYGTSRDDGIACFISTDMEHWSAMKENNGLALNKKDSYADRWYWAPEVYKLSDNKYVMFYSADEHICAAFSNSPKGPFVQKEKKPMFAEKGIDNHMFIDDDGQAYIYFCRFTNGNEIWAAKLDTSNFKIDEQSLVPCIHAEDPWETKMAEVTEGAFVKKIGEYYVLTYSANHYKSQDYAIGYAYSKSPLGPWVKSSRNPVYRRPGKLVGVGHHTLFTDLKGNEKVVFHAHNSDSIVAPRTTHITSYSLTLDNEGLPDLKIDNNYTNLYFNN